MAVLRESLIQFITRIMFLAAVFLIMTVLIFGIFRCSDDSMSTAVRYRDLALVYRLEKNYYTNDLAVWKYNDEIQIRRVVAIGGDTVDINEDGLCINGQTQSEPNIREETMAYEEGIEFPVTLESDEVFLLADARENATDSRYYGPVKISETKGTVVALLRFNGL